MTDKYDDTSKSYDIEHEYYDILFDDLNHDYKFYLDMAKHHGTPILECMCGTGRILLHLAGQGLAVDGFDLNDRMLNLAKEKIVREPDDVKNKIHIWKDDLRDFKASKKYNLIIIPFSSFLHILTKEDRLQAFAMVKNALADGGVFIVDIFNPDMTRPENVLRFDRGKIKQIPETGETLARFYSQQFNREKQTMEVQYIYDRTDSQGIVRRKFNTMEIAYLFYQDMKELAEETGLSIVQVYGDHDKSEFTEKSPTMIWVLKK